MTDRVKRRVERTVRGRALRQRARQLERVLLGGRGPVRMVLGWLGLLLVVALALLLGNIVLLAAVALLAVVAVVLGQAGTPSHWSHWLMVTSLVTGAASAGFVWWVAGVRLDAADTFTPEPALARWGGTALVILTGSVLGFLAAAAAAAARERSRAR